MIESILGPTHLLLIPVVALIVLGPKRLPEAGRGLGSPIRGFKDSLSTAERREEQPAMPPSREPDHTPGAWRSQGDPNGSVSRQHPRPATRTCQANQRNDAA
jgi:sec-independent protein translocase protein TatA